jgi:hydroxymethylpyrimidine/phosphomethylpyrimidine kinase
MAKKEDGEYRMAKKEHGEWRISNGEKFSPSAFRLSPSLLRNRPTVLTIAGSDSGGGAGIQGDLKTLEAFHVYGLTVLTSITAQNTRGVLQVFDLPVEVVAEQLKAVAEDIPIQAAKTGMLSNEQIIDAVASQLKEFGIRNLVVDPVMRAKSGDTLLAAEAEAALIRELLPLCSVVTPNLPEAAELSGFSIRDLPAMKEAARVIAGLGAPAVLIKGGHGLESPLCVDLYFDGRDFHEFSAERVSRPGGVHGTGCALSAAIAAGLAQGQDVLAAIGQAKSYITEAIKRHYWVGQGHPVLDHSWRCFHLRGE